MHVDQLFTLLFTSSKFYLDFHTTRRSTDIVQGAWTHSSSTGQKTRTVNVTVAIGSSIGPKTSQVTETQVSYIYLYSIGMEIMILLVRT